MPSLSDAPVKLLLSFIAGGIAGASAKTLIAPLDRVKILFQVSSNPFSARAVVEELRRTYKNEGFAALFKGNGAQVVRVYPYSGIQFMSFDLYRNGLLRLRHAATDGGQIGLDGLPRRRDGSLERLTTFERVLAGAAAGATSVTITYPLDVMRARLAVQRETPEGALRYRGLYDAFRSMLAEHGLRAFYRGITPTLLGILPYAGISFATFETLKHAVIDAATEDSPSALTRILCGGAAGISGQVLTYPLDIVRRRMQTEGYTPIHAHAKAPAAAAATASAHSSASACDAASSRSSRMAPIDSGSAVAAPLPPVASSSSTAAPFSSSSTARAVPPAPAVAAPAAVTSSGGRFPVAIHSMRATAARIVAEEGVRGLFKGLSMNFIKGPLSVGVSFTMYDLLKHWWGLPP